MGMTRSKARTGAELEPQKAPAETSVAIVIAKGDVGREGIEACDYALSLVEDVPGAVVDLSEAYHIDYRVTPMLVARRRLMKAHGRELAVAAGLASVRNILRASAGSDIPVFTTVDEAT